MSDRTDAMIKEVKRKSLARQDEILRCINQMAAANEKITFYSVSKRTGASKSYLYKNKAISTLIRLHRSDSETQQTQESQSVIINALKIKIKQLEAEINQLRKESNNSYKKQCEKLKKENKELKLQLQTAYRLYGDKKE
ncbi:DUF6262 family protein [Ruminococcus albus]|uniref:Transposase n=1 Tax=Ruminococcus albus TaxID=1264 RepID=A0A1H7PJM1_RUMAL|nr:DUF6262 family protein [Ruminococcus albus]SEL35981.1 hypothetical protein SAMN05216469_12223 [Ruminococcus albus]